MATNTVNFKVNKKIILLARLCIKLLIVLDILTLGLIHDRLLFQGEKIVKLIMSSRHLIKQV